MYVLGIDPGSVKMGWCVAEGQNGDLTVLESGTERIKLNKDHSLPERCALIMRFVAAIHERWPDIEVVGVEETVLGAHRGVRSALTLANARGAALGAACMTGAKVYELSPTAIKSSVTGDGRATKAQMKFAAEARTEKTGLMEDEADAIGAAIAASVEHFLSSLRGD